jgi:hypothetical protein
MEILWELSFYRRLTMTREELIELLKEQHALNAELKIVKEKEAKVRREICQELLKDKDVGKHRYAFPSMKVTATRNISHSLDQEKIRRLINDQEFTDDELEAIRVKYELNLTVYKQLEQCELLDSCITVKDAMPNLEIEYV